MSGSKSSDWTPERRARLIYLVEQHSTQSEALHRR